MKSVTFESGPPTVSFIPAGMGTWDNISEPLSAPTPSELHNGRKLAEASLAEAEAMEKADNKASHRKLPDDHATYNTKVVEPCSRSTNSLGAMKHKAKKFAGDYMRNVEARHGYAPEMPTRASSSNQPRVKPRSTHNVAKTRSAASRSRSRPSSQRARSDFDDFLPSDRLSTLQRSESHRAVRPSISMEELSKKALDFGKLAKEKFVKLRQ